MRFARIDGFASKGLVGCGQRAGTIDQPVSALDLVVGIGTNHQTLARRKAGEQIDVVVGRLDIVVEQARADDQVRVLRSGQRDTGIIEDRQVAFRSEMKDARALVLREFVAREIARRYRGVVGLVRHAELPELVLQVGTGPRRVRQQDDDAAGFPEGACGHGRIGKRVAPVVHDAPNVDEPDAAAAADLADGLDHGNFQGSFHGARLEA